MERLSQTNINVRQNRNVLPCNSRGPTPVAKPASLAFRPADRAERLVVAELRIKYRGQTRKDTIGMPKFNFDEFETAGEDFERQRGHAEGLLEQPSIELKALNDLGMIGVVDTSREFGIANHV